MIILDTLFPVFALIGLGTFLKRFNLISEPFLKTSDRLVYFIFFPTMLFWKIGSSPPADHAAVDLVAAALCALAVIYITSAACIKFFNVPRFAAGSFSQSCYRFNTYVGLAVILNAMGEPGVARFGILIGFIIPIINVLAVSTLLWYSGQTMGTRERLRVTLKALISNPLILGCLAGMVYSQILGVFPVFIDNTFRMAAMVTLPLALLSIGGTLTVKNLQNDLGYAFLGSVIKLLIFPLIGYFFLTTLHASPLSLQVGMIFFALPASPAIIVLSSQLNSDTKFASAAIVLSTLLSFISLSVVLLLF